MASFSHQTMIKAADFVGTAGLQADVAADESLAQEPQRLHARLSAAVAAGSGTRPQQAPHRFLNSEEAAFIEAAVARLMPADEWPGAREAGIPNYIDKQLGGAWGAAERLYRGGPWRADMLGQGYQLPFTPAELFRTALAAINVELKDKGGFGKLSPDKQDAYLVGLETGGKDLGGVPSEVFVGALWEAAVEGFFSDRSPPGGVVAAR